MLKKIIPPVIILLIGLGVFKGLSSLKKEPKNRTTPPAVKMLSVLKVNYKNNHPIITVLGEVKTKNRLTLISEVSGRIINSNFKLESGKSFKKGEILARVDNTIQKNNLRISISNLIISLSDMLPDLKIDMPNEFEKWNKFTEELSFNNIPALPKYSSNKEKIFVTKRGIYSKYYSLKNQKEMLKKYTIRAPFSGTVVKGNITVGSMASPNTPLAVIADTKRYIVKLPLAQTIINEVKVGMKVTLSLKDMNYQTNAKITRLSKVIDSQNQTQYAVAEFIAKPNSKIIDGSYVNATILGKGIKSFKISRSALFKDKYLIEVTDLKFLEQKKDTQKKKKNPEKKSGIYKKIEQKKVGTAKLIPVEVSFINEEDVYISGGIKEGSIVVSEPTQDIDNNTLITPIELKQSELKKVK